MSKAPAAQQCLDRAVAALMSKRDPRGFWEGRLASSPLATAVTLCAFANEAFDESKRTQAFAYLASTQNADGGWGDTDISKSNLAATLLVLSACTAGVPPASLFPPEKLTRAKSYVDKLGGLRDGLKNVYGKDLTFQVPIRMTAACAGLIPWTDVDPLPFELALAPRGLMGALRLPVVSYALPALVTVGLARHANAPSWFLPIRWLRAFATERALNTILAMQPESGGYLEAIPITAFSLLALKSAGRSDHAIANNARKFLRDTQREDGSWPVEVNLSVWNTTRAIDALHAAGLLEKVMTQQERDTTRDWLLAQQTKTKSVYSDAAPGGWGWNHLSGSVPDADDTSGAILALRALGVSDDHEAIIKGQAWLRSVQNKNGGWPTFCRGWETLPFDKSAPDLTAHALRALTPEKYSKGYFGVLEFDGSVNSSALLSGWQYLWASKRSDGSFLPLWFGCEYATDQLNSIYGTTHALFAMTQGYNAYEMGTGEETDFSEFLFVNASKYLLSIQNPDGGFGGCKNAPSSAEETGLALRALANCGVDNTDPVCANAARWLVEHQRPDGSWNPAPIGFYFAVLWYYEELYPLYYAIGGLGSWLKKQK
ncbi:MAG: prenyltransferase/squalene oxidase repeat-containing protein [Planctomycetota bacterium]